MKNRFVIEVLLKGKTFPYVREIETSKDLEEIRSNLLLVLHNNRDSFIDPGNSDYIVSVSEIQHVRITQCQPPFSDTSSSIQSPSASSGYAEDSPNSPNHGSLLPNPGGPTDIEIGRDRDRVQDLEESEPT